MLFIKSKNRRGALLPVSLGIVTLVAIVAAGTTLTLTDHAKLNMQRRQLIEAYHKSISGPELVKHWVNAGVDLSSDTSLPADLFEYKEPKPEDFYQEGENGLTRVQFKLEDRFPNLYAFLQSQPAQRYTFTRATLEAIQGTSNTGGVFTSSKRGKVGHIASLTIALPSGPYAPPNTVIDEDMKLALAVECVGESAHGVQRSNLSFMQLSPFFGIQIPAALLSYNTASAGGNVRVHWGDAWTKQTFEMLNRSQMNYLDRTSPQFDKWAKYRTEGRISFPSTWKWGLMQDLYDPASDMPGFPPANGKFRDAFYQNQTDLLWPDLIEHYEEFKQFAIENGRYFRTLSDGTIKSGDGSTIDFMTAFGYPDRAKAPYEFAFIDTVDQQPPRSDGSNLATIKIAGNTHFGIKGVFYLCANVEAAGIGSPPVLHEAENPDQTSLSLDTIFLDGVLYSAGTLEMSGNNGVYGSVIADRGFKGTGTPNVYFNYRLLYGMPLDHGNLGSRLVTVLQSNYGGSRI